MEQSKQTALMRRVLTHVDAGTTDMVAQEFKNPVSRYLDQDQLERELTHLFRELPVGVGHITEIPAPGDYKTVQIGNVPLIVVRHKDGTVRALVNACRHRGHKLIQDGQGKCRSFVCPYHAWTYGTDGSLVGLPRKDAFPNVNQSEHGLVEVPLHVRAGFMYVSVNPKAGHAIDSWLGEAGVDLAAIGTGDWNVHSPELQKFDTNWKLPFDIFLENYHTKKLHQDSIYPVFEANVAVFDKLGEHVRCVLPKRSVHDIRDQDPNTWNLIEHATLLYVLFPNTMIAILPEHAGVWHVFPNGVGKCEMHHYTLASKRAQSPRGKDEWQKSLHVVSKVIEEDVSASFGIQATLKSGANREFTFGRFEQCLAWFHSSIERFTHPELGESSPRSPSVGTMNATAP